MELNSMNYKTFDKKRPVSWSFISSFEYNPEQWYENYVLGIKSTSKEMTFGSSIDLKLQDDPKFLPHVVRYPIMQHKMEAKFGKVPLIGVADTYRPKGYQEVFKVGERMEVGGFLPASLRDYKTGKKAWDQKRADETGQLTMYCLLLWFTEKIQPEHVDLYIDWLPTKEGGDFAICFRDNNVKAFTFKTRRTMQQVLEFGQRIHKVLAEAEAYCKSHAQTT